MVRVKICGITRAEDARHAARCGADAIGFVFAESSRKISPGAARKISTSPGLTLATVGVFVDEPVDRMLRIAEQCRLTALQLHGDESDAVVRKAQRAGYQVLKAFRIAKKDDLEVAADAEADALLFDASVSGQRGGTGQSFDWALLKGLRTAKPWFVSGGLDPKNVRKLLSEITPYGVDVSSGVESAPGKKSAQLVKEFIKNAKSSR